MEKSIIIQEIDGKFNIVIKGFNTFEAMGILRFHEKDLWLQTINFVNEQRKESTKDIEEIKVPSQIFPNPEEGLI